MNTKQQTLLEEINHNVVAIGRFLIESLTPKRKQESLSPRIKRKQTLADMIVKVLSESKETISCSMLADKVRNLPYPYGDKFFSPTLKRLLKKGAIKMQKAGRYHLYSIAHKAGRRAA